MFEVSFHQMSRGSVTGGAVVGGGMWCARRTIVRVCGGVKGVCDYCLFKRENCTSAELRSEVFGRQKRS